MLSGAQKQRLRRIIKNLRDAGYTDEEMISRHIHWQVSTDPSFHNPHSASREDVNQFLAEENLPRMSSYQLNDPDFH